MRNGFDWNDLRHFLGVARAGTVSLAARRMGLNHATIIRRIEALEHALGTKLFDRNARGYTLTPRGERLLASAEAMEEEALKVDRDVASTMSQVGGLVRVGTLEGFGNFFLASRLPRFAADYPNLVIELTIIQQIVALSRREADIGVTLQPPQGEGFFCEKLTDYALFVYGAREYLERHPVIATRTDLLSHTFCGYIDGLVFVRGLDYLGEVCPGLEARLQSSSLHAQMEAVCEGYGLCVLPAFVAAHRPDLVRVLPEEVVLRRSYWLVASASLAAGPRVQAARRFIRKEVEQAQPLFLGLSPSPLTTSGG